MLHAKLDDPAFIKAAKEMGYLPGDAIDHDTERAIRNQVLRYANEKVDRKETEGKPLPLLCPYEALVAYSKVSDYGLGKYGNRDSWKNSTAGLETYSNAAARHLFQDGIDKESNLPHVYHALWNAAAAVWHYESNKQR